MDFSLDVTEEIENLRKEEKVTKVKQEAKKIYYKGRYESLPFVEKKIIYIQFKEIFILQDFRVLDRKSGLANSISEYYIDISLKIVHTYSSIEGGGGCTFKKEEDILNSISENISKMKQKWGTDEEIKKRMLERIYIIKSIKDFFDCLILNNVFDIYREKQQFLENFYQKYPFMEIYDINEIISEYEKSNNACCNPL